MHTKAAKRTIRMSNVHRVLLSNMAEDVSHRKRNDLIRLYVAVNETVNKAVVTSETIFSTP